MSRVELNSGVSPAFENRLQGSGTRDTPGWPLCADARVGRPKPTQELPIDWIPAWAHGAGMERSGP